MQYQPVQSTHPKHVFLFFLLSATSYDADKGPYIHSSIMIDWRRVGPNMTLSCYSYNVSHTDVMEDIAGLGSDIQRPVSPTGEI